MRRADWGQIAIDRCDLTAFPWYEVSASMNTSAAACGGEGGKEGGEGG